MMIEDNEKPVTELESSRRYRESMMHLFDEDEVGEKALCGASATADDRRSMKFYLEDRLHGAAVGTVCEGCKVSAPRFAMELAQDLETEGILDEADDYRRLARTLLEETGQNVSDG